MSNQWLARKETKCFYIIRPINLSVHPICQSTLTLFYYVSLQFYDKTTLKYKSVVPSLRRSRPLSQNLGRCTLTKQFKATIKLQFML